MEVELKNVSKTYATGRLTVSALVRVSLVIKSGEIVAIMGPSGSGKSTLMHIIGLLDRPTTGELKLGGERLALSMSDRKLAQLRSQKIGFVFQSFNLLPRLSALDNVLLPTLYLRRDRGARARAVQLLTEVGLADRLHHRPGELSGGEKQRVAIARALINDPGMVLADEPTGNLDSRSGRQVVDILQNLQKKGKTVVIITHDAKVAAAARRTIRLLDGSVVKGDA